MKTLEEKKIEKLPKHITTKELEDLFDSEEMKKLVRKLEERERYQELTKNVNIGEY